MSSLSIAGRILLFRHKILRFRDISNHLRIYHTNSPEAPVILRTSYPGDVNYHKFTAQEASDLASEAGRTPMTPRGGD
jgi:hypothetical protein